MAVKWTRRSLVLGLAATAGLPSVARAQSGKSLTIYVGFAAGGAVDLYARLVGKYMAQEMGLAGAIVQNIPGAGSIEAANRLFNAAPKDGLTIGALGRGIVTEPLFENANARYIAAKFNWIGSPSRENATVLSFGNSKFRSLDDLRKFEMKVGATKSSAPNCGPFSATPAQPTSCRRWSGAKSTALRACHGLRPYAAPIPIGCATSSSIRSCNWARLPSPSLKQRPA